MMNKATLDFIRQHRSDDVRTLALRQAPRAPKSSVKAAGNDTATAADEGPVDLTMALQQISGWQTARQKLPTWAATDGIIYPPHLNMEQCSSELTARYKAALCAEISNLKSQTSNLIDLTGGFGVDFYWMARGFSRRIYVEQQAALCDVARHNFALLGLPCEVICGSAADVLAQTEPVDVVFMDPARRDQQGSRTYAISDCTPNVLELLPLLRQKAARIILKLSPMLDWHKAVSDLEGVSEVHVVSVQNECKELLIEVRGARYEVRDGLFEVRGARYEVREYQKDEIKVHCVNLLSDGTQQHFSFSYAENSADQHISHLVPRTSYLENTSPLAPQYLYEPNASIMKAGCFEAVGQAFGVQEVAANSHLFTAEREIADFPGRRFGIERVTTMNRHELKEALGGLTQANIAVRNFPLSAAELRKRLRLKDGGDTYLFATTAADGRHLLLVCRKIG